VGTLAAPVRAVATPVLEPEPGSQSLKQRFMSALEGMEIADSHEHLLEESERVAMRIDFFSLIGHYAIGDAICAGMPAEALQLMQNKGLSDVERWRAVEPYWKYSRFTAITQCLRLAVRDIYGFDEICASTISPINDAIRARNKPGFYHYIFKEKARIRFWVLDDRHDNPIKPDRDYFVTVREFDDFALMHTSEHVHQLEQMTDVSITSLADLKRALHKNFQEAVDTGIVGIKSVIAYFRDIHFREVTEQEAASDFESLMGHDRPFPEGFRQRVERPYRNLEDYMFHEVIKLCEAHHLPVQFHTGLNGTNYIENTNPTHLTNLFFLYPQVRFSIFHMSYPYWEELSALARGFANVFIDCTGAPIISPELAVHGLAQYLDMVPSNKIQAFGGDYFYAEDSYAHAKMARRVVAQVLAGKVEEGYYTETEALEVGKRLLHDNAAALFFDKRPGPFPTLERYVPGSIPA
jgi:predicted TIM-barrel fold metal-dependent hydrolase